jgi:hypothetical protein
MVQVQFPVHTHTHTHTHTHPNEKTQSCLIKCMSYKHDLVPAFLCLGFIGPISPWVPQPYSLIDPLPLWAVSSMWTSLHLLYPWTILLVSPGTNLITSEKLPRFPYQSLGCAPSWMRSSFVHKGMTARANVRQTHRSRNLHFTCCPWSRQLYSPLKHCEACARPWLMFHLSIDVALTESLSWCMCLIHLFQLDSLP